MHKHQTKYGWLSNRVRQENSAKQIAKIFIKRILIIFFLVPWTLVAGYLFAGNIKTYKAKITGYLYTTYQAATYITNAMQPEGDWYIITQDESGVWLESKQNEYYFIQLPLEEL